MLKITHGRSSLTNDASLLGISNNNVGMVGHLHLVFADVADSDFSEAAFSHALVKSIHVRIRAVPKCTVTESVPERASVGTRAPMPQQPLPQMEDRISGS